MEEFKSKIVEIKQCKNGLLFNPLNPISCRHLPVAINNQLISGFDQIQNESTLVNNFESTNQDTNLIIFKSLYPELSFIETLEIYSCGIFADFFSAQSFFNAYGYGFNPNYSTLKHIMSSLKPPILSMLKERKWNANDLAPLSLLNNQADSLSKIEKLFGKIHELNLSKSMGAQALELSVDLICLDKSVDEILSQTTTDWISYLKALRHPNTQMKEAETIQNTKLNWPSNVKVQWLRRGDRFGVELNSFICHPHEFKKILTALEETQKQWAFQLENKAHHEI